MKKTMGRQKIEIKKIEKLSNRQVTFSKRRAGVFKKASELCILSGAAVAILVHSPGKRLFSFGHPTADAVIGRFLGGGDADAAALEGHSFARYYNMHYSDVCRELKTGSQLKKERTEDEYGGGGWGEGMWWDENVDGLDLEDLEQYLTALEDLMKKVTMRANDLMLIQSSSSILQTPALVTEAASSAARSVADEMGASLTSQMSGSFDYDNFISQNWFGQEQLQT